MESAPSNAMELPLPILERVMLQLSDVSLACFAQSCRTGREASLSPSFWRARCQHAFGDVTEWCDWQTSDAAGCFATAAYSHLAPTSSRGVYRVLRHLQRLIGLWQYQETGRFGKHHLVSCTWGEDHLQLMLVKVYDQGLRRTELARVSAQGLWMLEQGADDRICVLHEFEAKPASPIYSPAAAAAASVAIMGHHRQADGLRDVSGTSPPGSFEHEMLRFMQGQVAGSRKSRRRSPGYSSGGASPHPSVASIVLRRLPTPPPGRARPLEGLYRVAVLHPPQPAMQLMPSLVVQLRYVCQGPAAMIQAWKVAGHSGASQMCLEVGAAPMPPPWPSGHMSAAMTALQYGHTSSGSSEWLDLHAGSALSLCNQMLGDDRTTPVLLCRNSEGNIRVVWLRPHVSAVFDYTRVEL